LKNLEVLKEKLLTVISDNSERQEFILGSAQNFLNACSQAIGSSTTALSFECHWLKIVKVLLTLTQISKARTSASAASLMSHSETSSFAEDNTLSIEKRQCRALVIDSLKLATSDTFLPPASQEAESEVPSPDPA
jgi:predicted ATP-dependent serine protease